MSSATIINVSANDIEAANPLTYATASRELTLDELQDRLAQFKGIKWRLVMTVKMIKYNREDEEVTMKVVFYGDVEILLHDADFNSQCKEQVICITKKIDEFVKLGSGWSVDKIVSLELYIVPYQPVSKASCYVATLGYIAAKKAVLNIVNDNDFCFVCCVLASMHNVGDHANKVGKYIQYFNELDLTGLNFPMRVQDVKKFEKLDVKISVNVFAFDNKDLCLYPVYITSDREREHHVNLLLATNETR